MRVLGIAGSLRRDSHNRRLLRAAAALLPPDAEFVEFAGLKAIPAFDEDDEAAPGPAVEVVTDKPFQLNNISANQEDDAGDQYQQCKHFKGINKNTVKRP